MSVGPGEKARRKFSSMGGRAPGYRLSPDHFQTVKRMLVPDWAQKMLCIIVPNRRTASPEFFSWVRTRRLLSRHSCPVRSPSFPNQKRRNYRWVENRFWCSAGQERYLAYSFAHNSVYLPKKTGSFQLIILYPTALLGGHNGKYLLSSFLNDVVMAIFQSI